MDYYLNEYSLRGQFKDIEEFFKSLREDTLPVLKKIQEQEDNIIWKKDIFWQSEVCKGISLTKMPEKKNERSAEMVALKIQLARLMFSEPFWGDNSEANLEIKEYKFDKDYREKFELINCFTKAIETEGRIISFIHPEYKISQLPVIVEYNNNCKEYNIDNIYNLNWWESEPEIRTWRINSKYLIQVRAREFDYHPPHFHAISKDFQAVFKLSNGELYKYGKKKWTNQMITEVQEWYQVNKEELQRAWEILHNN